MDDRPVSTSSTGRSGRRQWTVVLGLAAVTGLLMVVGLVGMPTTASAQEATVDLGTAEPFLVLGGQTVTNTGPTIVDGDLGVSPGSAVTGFPPGVVNGTIHAADTVAAAAQADLVAAYNDAAARTATANIAGDLGGLTLTTGVYNASSSIGLTGDLILDGQGDLDSVFIFQIGSTLTTASGSSVTLINGAQACNVFWQVGSSATLGTGSSFAGNILALTSITVTTGVVVEGRALARNGAVTLDTNVFVAPECAIAPTTTTPPPPTTTTTIPGPGETETDGVGGPGEGIDADELANTGSTPGLTPLAVLGSLLFVLGGLVLVITRTRARSADRPQSK